MNQSKDFTEDSEWITPNGIKVKFHSFCQYDGIPMFTSDQENDYDKRGNGTFGFTDIWKHFKRIEND